MCFGDGPLGFDRASRTKRWGVATDAELAAALREPGLVWLDVRSDGEARAAPMPAALRVRRCACTMFSTAELARRAPTLLPDRAAPILVFCAGGGRADEARKCLRGLGYTGSITNGGMPEDLAAIMPDALAAAAEQAAAEGCTSSPWCCAA